MKKTMLCAVAVAALCACGGENAWSGKKVAYLGDSITDARHIGCTSNYWNFLEAKLGIVPLVYGINGHQMKHLVGQAEKLKAEHPDDVDAIFVFAGTNDFNSNTPPGSWYEETTETVNRNGKQVALKHRGFVYGEATFRGRINSLMKCLRENFPSKPVYLLTPVHRGYATFGAGNVQPDESYANEIGEYVDAYVHVVKEAGNVWAVTVIDINAESGLFPLFSSHAQFFHNAQTDMLHPNNSGHERIADAIAARLLSRVCP